ncbi:hypothetical protein TRFO_37032 [Tritrichomonas foetus]|uniref:Uncharacterized protein n=1 Tax=Tritrichomonas foetus TaxID=1144522 RepID=A0A1J4JC87_9EUKA|nr:hypothetical protein TRFO_37032 [Tritrichomonas foetus]|eukprot:OHS96752.1 hypothetical protein TRFO_37032 [Tritrichomonas foetus]
MNSSFSFSDVSDDEKSYQIIKLNHQNQQLQDTIKNLSNQLSSVREQYTQSALITSSIDTAYNERKKANKKISQICAEKDDLQNRLNMCLRLNSDLQCKIHLLENDTIKTPQFVQTIKSLKQENESLKKMNNKLKKTCSNKSDQLNQILNAATCRFQIRFEHPKCLTRFLCGSEPKPKEIIQTVIVPDPKIDKLKNDIQNLKCINNRLNNHLVEVKERLIKERMGSTRKENYDFNTNSDDFDSDLRFEKQDMALKKLYNEMNSQRHTIAELKKERDQLASLVQRQNDFLRKLEFRIQKNEISKRAKK